MSSNTTSSSRPISTAAQRSTRSSNQQSSTTTSNGRNKQQLDSEKNVRKDRQVFLNKNGIPKRPPSSFAIYKHRLRKRIKGPVNFTKFNKAAIKKWRSLSDEAKAPFRERARKLMRDYNRYKQLYMKRKLRTLRKRFGPSVVSPSPEPSSRRRRSKKANILADEGDIDGTVQTSRRRRRQTRRSRSSSRSSSNASTESNDSQQQQASTRRSATKSGRRRQNKYILFAKRERPKIIREMPNATFAQIARELGQRWRSLSRAAQDRYKQQRSVSPAGSSENSSRESTDVESLAVSPVSNVRSLPSPRRGSSLGSSRTSILSRSSRESSS